MCLDISVAGDGFSQELRFGRVSNDFRISSTAEGAETFPNTIYLYLPLFLPMSAPLFPTSHFLFQGSDICYLLNEMIYTGVYMALAKVVISHALLHTQEHALLSWPTLRILDAPLPLHNHCHIPIHIRRMAHSQLNLSIMT